MKAARCAMHREIHLTITQNGHAMSTDCWCEPVDIERVPARDGGPDVLVVKHNDYTMDSRADVDRRRAEGASGPMDREAGLDDPWITRRLAGVGSTKGEN